MRVQLRGLEKMIEEKIKEMVALAMKVEFPFAHLLEKANAQTRALDEMSHRNRARSYLVIPPA